MWHGPNLGGVQPGISQCELEAGVQAGVWPVLGQAMGLLLMPGERAALQCWCKGQSAQFGVKDVQEEFDARKSADGTNIGSTANASESIIGGV